VFSGRNGAHITCSLSGPGATEFVPSLSQKQIPQNRIERRHSRYPISGRHLSPTPDMPIGADKSVCETRTFPKGMGVCRFQSDSEFTALHLPLIGNPLMH